MKLVVMAFFIFGVCSAVYLFITYFFIHFKELKKINWIAFAISGLTGVGLICLITLIIYTASNRGETWCDSKHYTNSYPPLNLVTATDYFENGNYEYDKGSCDKAIESYTKAIELEPSYPQSYNNRAYTYMKMENYNMALNDLNTALILDPNYLHALRNRADVNTYRMNNKAAAIMDYQKIIELSGPTNDVCAHLADANNTSKNPFSFLKVIKSTIDCGRGK